MPPPCIFRITFTLARNAYYRRSRFASSRHRRASYSFALTMPVWWLRNFTAASLPNRRAASKLRFAFGSASIAQRAQAFKSNIQHPTSYILQRLARRDEGSYAISYSDKGGTSILLARTNPAIKGFIIDVIPLKSCVAIKVRF